jgi:hypothetical protein
MIRVLGVFESVLQYRRAKGFPCSWLSIVLGKGVEKIHRITWHSLFPSSSNDNDAIDVKLAQRQRNNIIVHLALFQLLEM